MHSENLFIGNPCLGHAGRKWNSGAGDRAVACVSSKGGLSPDRRRHGNAESSRVPSSQALGADAWRGQFHAARARAALAPRAALSAENAAASVLGGGVEGHMASRGGTACLAEPHYGRRHVGYNLRLPGKRDLPVHHAVGLYLA